MWVGGGRVGVPGTCCAWGEWVGGWELRGGGYGGHVVLYASWGLCWGEGHMPGVWTGGTAWDACLRLVFFLCTYSNIP